MKEYHKIQTVFKRDSETKYKTLLEGQFSLPEFDYLQNNRWEFSEKIDGTCIRIIFNGETITFGGKTDRARIQPLLLTKLKQIFLPKIGLFKELFKDNKEICLYGEGYGAKIQKGGSKYRLDPSFVLFDVKIGPWWLQRQTLKDIANKLNIDTVPIIEIGNLWDMVNMAREGFTSKWGNFIAEGIVARPQIELKARNGTRIITKIKHKDFPVLD